MARKAQSAVAASIHPQVIESTLARLPETTDAPTVRAAVPDALKTGHKVTGQWLYDNFVMPDKADQSKMDIVRGMVAMTVAEFSAVLKDFVSTAKGYADRAKGTPNQRTAEARYKTAQNHQTVMRIAYGALKFCQAELVNTGYKPEDLGYQLMRVAGSAVLKAKGIKWDGTPVEKQEDKQARKAAAVQAVALAEVMAKNPIQPGESRADYLARIDKTTQNVIDEKAKQARSEMVASIVASLRETHADLLTDIIAALTAKPAEA